MTADAPSWFAKVGPWTALLCAGLLVMALAGVIQIMFVRQAADYMTQMGGYELPGTSTYVGISIASIIVRMALLLLCVGLLASQFQRSSVHFVIGALWFIYPVLATLSGALARAAIDLDGTSMAPPLVYLDLAFNIAITAYLLFSRRVAELYHIDTRTRIPATLRKLWAQARGRPIPEEIEASRLHETFK